MKTELWLVRHGETEENVAAILQGHLPGTLTPLGIRQAEALRDTLRGTHFDAFLVSDLRRTMHTAEILQPAVGLPIQPTSLLRERDWGSLTGCKIADVQGRDFASRKVGCARESLRDSSSPESFHSLARLFPSDVESVETMFARARKFLYIIGTQYAHQRVLAVTHGLFARCIRAAHADCTIRDIPRMSNAEVCRLEVRPVATSNSFSPSDLCDSDASAN